jgi:hypothetical protein
MCERCDAPLGSLDDRLDLRLSRTKHKLVVRDGMSGVKPIERVFYKRQDSFAANKEDDSFGGIGYWASVIGLVALLGLVIVNVFGL